MKNRNTEPARHTGSGQASTPPSDQLAGLLTALSGRAERVAALQSALTACKAMGPENGGQGEMEKVRLLTSWFEAYKITDLRRVDAPDARVPGGLRPNLIARLPGASPRTLWLFGHMDVVPPGDVSTWSTDPWQVRREGDMLYGRGVEDNQQALVSMLLLAEELQAHNVKPQLSLGLVCMADEENGNTHGLAHVLAAAPELFQPDDLYIVPDSGSPTAELVEVAEKCVLWLKLEITGVQCHASTPQHGRNAFLAGAALVLACHDLHEAFPQRDELFDPPHSTFVPSKHEANVPSVNILPGRDVFYLDCRLVPGVDPEAVLEALRQKARQVEARHQVTVALSVVQLLPASASPVESPVVTALVDAVEQVYAVRARPAGIGGSTVAALLRHKGLPAAVWSCIQNTCHQPDERSSISATYKDAQVFARLLLNPALVSPHA